MAEYISRDEVINLIMHNDKVCHYADERYENVVYATAQTICKVVSDIPAADVQPVKRGRWIIKGQEIYCSECDTESSYNSFGASQFTRFCPNCGARMGGDTE